MLPFLTGRKETKEGVLMNIECESCGGTEWVATIHELRIRGIPAVYSAIKCKNCGAVYPMTHLGTRVTKEQVKSFLR